ncbi:MAG TPA: condensation domain-containing protein, partial [Puia sp.]|nr:condensation domain-containing protein [Puia sp.]
LCPVGVAGEIRIGGDGVSTGYWNNNALTKTKFIADTFTGAGKVYLTGDRGRWLADGNIEFLGRVDDQVKIRGYRVEPGEVTRRLTSIDGVDAALVLAVAGTGGEKELAAYFVAKDTIAEELIREELSRELPSYMLPRFYIRLAQMPLTPNGKIDRRRLPLPDGNNVPGMGAYEAPVTWTEQALSEIWCEVLGRESVGRKDNFFVLGGHSLKATRLASQIHRVFGVRVEFHELFDHILLADQASMIDRARQEQYTGIPVADRMEDYPLSSSQRRLWLLSQVEASNIAYNVPGVFRFEGELDVEALEKAFVALIERHEILRTAFHENEQGEVRQVILPVGQVDFAMGIEDLRDQVDVVRKRIALETARPFDLSAGCLLRALLLRVEDEKWVFFYNLHHIASDGWSKTILLREVLNNYDCFRLGIAPELRPLDIQYKDYAVWQQRELSGEMLEGHRGWWLRQFEDAVPLLDLPADKPRPGVKTYNGAAIMHQFSKELTGRLNDYCLRRGGTLFMGLYAVVRSLLHRYTGAEDIVIGTPIAGRGHADLEDQIGFYVNTLALRTLAGGTDSFDMVFRKVREVTLGAFEHQVYPFDELLDALQLQWDRSRHPLFDVMIVLQNIDTSSVKAVDAAADKLTVKAYEEKQRIVSLFDLRFDFIEDSSGLRLTLEYNTDLYAESRVLRMAGHLEALLHALVESPDVPVGQLDYLSDREREQVISEFNATEAFFERELTLGDWFVRQALASPQKPAIIFGEQQTSYGELEERSRQLADFL